MLSHRPAMWIVSSRLATAVALALTALVANAIPAHADSTRLAPPIDEGSDVGPGQLTNYIFWDKTWTVNYDGGPMCLSSAADSCRPPAIDDEVRIFVGGVEKFRHESRTEDFGPVDFSGKLQVGTNQVRVQLIDRMGPSRGGSALYLSPSAGGVSANQRIALTWTDQTVNDPTIVRARVTHLDGTPWSGVAVNFLVEHGVPFDSPVTTNSDGWAQTPIVIGAQHYLIAAGSAAPAPSSLVTASTSVTSASISVSPSFAVVLEITGGENSVQWCDPHDITLDCFPLTVGQRLKVGMILKIRVSPTTVKVRLINGHTGTASTESVTADQVPIYVALGAEGFSGQKAIMQAELESRFMEWYIKPNKTMTLMFNLSVGRYLKVLRPGWSVVQRFVGGKVVNWVLEQLPSDDPYFLAESSTEQAAQNMMANDDDQKVIAEVWNDGAGRIFNYESNPLSITTDENQLIIQGGEKAFIKPDGLVIQDSVAPTSSLTLFGTRGANDWYNSAVTATLSASDGDGSGIRDILYSLDAGTTWVPYTERLAFPTEGVTQLCYKSVDRMDNEEVARCTAIKRDWTPPQTTAFVIGPKDVNGLMRDNVVVMFVVVDNISGKWYTEYAGVDGTGSWTRLYGGQDRFSIDKNGVFQFRYRSVDMAGNHEREIDSGPIVISRWLVYCTGSDQCIQLSGNYNMKLTGDLFSNGSYGITGNLWPVITGLLRSVNGGNVVSGNIYSMIPEIQAGASAVALGPYPVSYYLARATRIYNSSTTFNSISDVLAGVIYVRGDVTLKTIKVSGNVVIIAEGTIYDDSITNAFVSDDPSNGITLYSMKDVKLKNIGTKYVGMVYAPYGSIIIDGPINFVLRGSLIARKVLIMNTHGFDARYDAAILSGSYQLPLSSIANPSVGSGPAATTVQQPSATPTSVSASSTPTQVPVSPTATRTPTLVPSPSATPSRTPTSAPPTATTVIGATPTPCSGVQAPTLLGPVNGSTVGSLRPTLTWQAASGAFYTYIQLSADSAFAGGVTTYETIFSSYTPPTNLPAHATMYWRGRSRALIGSYANCWSPTWSFTTP